MSVEFVAVGGPANVEKVYKAGLHPPGIVTLAVIITIPLAPFCLVATPEFESIVRVVGEADDQVTVEPIG